MPRTITLAIEPVGAGAALALRYSIYRNGQPLLVDGEIASSALRALHEWAREYRSMFEQPTVARVDPARLEMLGGDLFDLWLASTWEKLHVGVAPEQPRTLAIATEVSDILNLPWELLRPPGETFLGLNPTWGLRRRPHLASGLDLPPRALPHGPLRVLFVACAPTDLPPLDFEREHARILEAVGSNASVEIADMGTFDELRQRVAKSHPHPHLVHLTGHSAVGPDGVTRFAFEDEAGLADLRSPTQLRDDIFANSGVQCVFLSGCQSAQAPANMVLGGLCQALVGNEVPLAVGWSASIRDRLATAFADTFYRSVAGGEPIDGALQRARQALNELSGSGSFVDPSWTLPVLYATTSQQVLIDGARRRAAVRSEVPSEEFVGRRRDQQQLLSALRTRQSDVVLISGMGGIGKSALAARVAHHIGDQGMSSRILTSRVRPDLAAQEHVYELNLGELSESEFFTFLANDPIVDSRHLRRALLAEVYRMLGGSPLLLQKVRPILRTIAPSVLRRQLLELSRQAPSDDNPLARARGELFEAIGVRHLYESLSPGARAALSCAAVLNVPVRLHELAVVAGVTPSSMRAYAGAWRDRALVHTQLTSEGQRLWTVYGALRAWLQSHLTDDRRKLAHARSGRMLKDLEGGRFVGRYGLSWMDCLLEARWHFLAAADLESSIEVTDRLSDELMFHGDFTRVRDLNRELLAYGEHATLLMWMGRAHYEMGEYAEAYPYALRAQEMNEQQLGSNHPEAAQGLTNLAYILRERGQAVDAFRYLQRALEIYRRNLGPDDPTTATCLANVGALLLGQGDTVAARAHLEQALDIRERVLGPNHPDTAVSLTSMGLLLQRLGDLAAARTYLDRALETNERVLASRHPVTVASQIHLGTLLREQGDLVGARPLLEQSLAIRERVLGPGHVDTAETLELLGRLLMAQGELPSARRLCERALGVHDAIFGEYHPRTAANLAALAAVVQAQGELATAVALFERALDIWEHVAGPDDPDLLEALRGLASALRAQGDLAGARVHLERALRLCEQGLGPDHLETAITINAFGSLLQALGDLEPAQHYLERGVAIEERVLGRGHPSTGAAYTSLANVLRVRGNHAAASEYFTRALENAEQAFGPDHTNTASALNNLGTFLREQGDLTGARLHLERSLTLSERALGPNHPDIASRCSNFALLLNDAGDLDQARAYMERALHIRQLHGDRAGEATCFFLLGRWAIGAGKLLEGARLVALCCAIEQQIQHRDAEQDLRQLISVTGHLHYSERDVAGLLEEVTEQYEVDQGWGLVKAAFARHAGIRD